MRKIAAFLAALLMLIPGVGHANDTRPDVVGGQPVQISDAPWQVALVRASEPDNYTAQFCGGSIISASWIVTAAHCVDTVASASDVAVLAGSATLSAASRLPIAQIVIHPEWDPSTERNDLALVRLDSPLALNGTTVAPISLPVAQDPATWPPSGDVAVVSGWGSTGPSFPDRLNAATVQVLAGPSQPDCGLYGGVYDPAVMLCAGAPQGGIDTCEGDSGGPLVVKVLNAPVLAGITSFGKDCAQAGYPGVYTRVTAFTGWLLSQTGLAGQVIVNATALSFGGVQVGATGSQTITISNPGTSSQPLTAVSVQGLDPSQFAVTGSTCHGYLVSGASCTVTVVFRPTSKGPKSAALRLGPSTVSVELTGQAQLPLPRPVTRLKATAGPKKLRLSWARAADATSYRVAVKGRNTQRKRLLRETEVRTPKASIRATLRRPFTVCVTAANETGLAAPTCRTYARR